MATYWYISANVTTSLFNSFSLIEPFNHSFNCFNSLSINRMINPHLFDVISRPWHCILISLTAAERSKRALWLKNCSTLSRSSTIELHGFICIVHPIDGSTLLPLRITPPLPLPGPVPLQLLPTRGRIILPRIPLPLLTEVLIVGVFKGFCGINVDVDVVVGMLTALRSGEVTSWFGGYMSLAFGTLKSELRGFMEFEFGKVRLLFRGYM